MPPPPSKALMPYVITAEFSENPMDCTNDTIISCLQLTLPNQSLKLSKQQSEHETQLISIDESIPNVTLNPLKQLFQSWYQRRFHWKLMARRMRRLPMEVQERSLREREIMANPELRGRYRG